MSFCTCIEPGQGRDLPSCPLCPMVPWKDMSDPGKAWQDKKVFPDEFRALRLQMSDAEWDKALLDFM